MQQQQAAYMQQFGGGGGRGRGGGGGRQQQGGGELHVGQLGGQLRRVCPAGDGPAQLAALVVWQCQEAGEVSSDRGRHCVASML